MKLTNITVYWIYLGAKGGTVLLERCDTCGVLRYKEAPNELIYSGFGASLFDGER
ncbi:hypothetical protein [Zooshikella sp. RANM57]|uniref:hypothetical protein n=1 Tax=Zooshikella sp. RANM57 TaxID=3425863 RepID=UPI003D6EAB6A